MKASNSLMFSHIYRSHFSFLNYSLRKGTRFLRDDICNDANFKYDPWKLMNHGSRKLSISLQYLRFRLLESVARFQPSIMALSGCQAKECFLNPFYDFSDIVVLDK